MKIEPTPPKAIADNKTVAIGDGMGPFRVIPTTPKVVIEQKSS